MVKKFLFDKEVFISPKADLDEIDEFFSKFNIKVFWLLKDGILFEYPDSMNIYNYPGDFSFYDSMSNLIVLTIVINFYKIEVLDREQEILTSIPIINLDKPYSLI